MRQAVFILMVTVLVTLVHGGRCPKGGRAVVQERYLNCRLEVCIKKGSELDVLACPKWPRVKSTASCPVMPGRFRTRLCIMKERQKCVDEAYSKLERCKKMCVMVRDTDLRHC